MAELGLNGIKRKWIIGTHETLRAILELQAVTTNTVATGQIGGAVMFVAPKCPQGF